jgi:hypothetical protein
MKPRLLGAGLNALADNTSDLAEKCFLGLVYVIQQKHWCALLWCPDSIQVIVKTSATSINQASTATAKAVATAVEDVCKGGSVQKQC